MSEQSKPVNGSLDALIETTTLNKAEAVARIESSGPKYDHSEWTAPGAVSAAIVHASPTTPGKMRIAQFDRTGFTGHIECDDSQIPEELYQLYGAAVTRCDGRLHEYMLQWPEE
jgi:hypothetical protein